MHLIMMEALLGVTILVILGGVTSQNHDGNAQILYKKEIRPRSVEVTTVIPPDPKIHNDEIKLFLTRLEALCVENLEYLISDTNKRFQSLEHQSSEVHSTVGLLVEKLNNLTTEVGRMSQCCSSLATAVVSNNENLEVKVENLGKNIQILINATRNLPSDIEAIKQNVSSLFNVSRSVVDSSPKISKQISNERLQEPKDLQITASTSNPLSFTVDKQYPKNCAEVQKSGEKASGIYTIHPDRALKPFEVVCDLETRGGNWTVIQRRYDGSQDFILGWEDYKNGFGNLQGEFWLGLENIHILTGFDVNELLIELRNFESQNKSALYSQFSVGSETEEYSLKILSGYSGDAGESMIYNVGSKFSTKDKDQDSHATTNCAQDMGGAWWYNYCTYSNLNGVYYDHGQVPQEVVTSWNHGIFWIYNFHVERKSLIYTRMLVRPKV